MILLSLFIALLFALSGSAQAGNLDPPSLANPFGTDRLGRAMGTQLIMATLGTLWIALCAVFFSALLGFSFGLMRAFAAPSIRIRLTDLLLLCLIPIPALLVWMGCQKTCVGPEMNFYRLFGLLSALALGLFSFTIIYIARDQGIHLRPKSTTSSFSAALPMDALMESVMALPSYLIALALAVKWTPGMASVTAALALTLWPYTGRLFFRALDQASQRDYCTAALASGYSKIQILRYEILPAVIPTALQALLGTAAMAIAGEAALGFLELGPIAGSASSLSTLGSIAANCRHYPSAWWLTLFPAILIILLTWFMRYWARQLDDFRAGR